MIHRFQRLFVNAPEVVLGSKPDFGVTYIPFVAGFLLVGIMFVGDSFVFAGEPASGDALFVQLFSQNRYGEAVIGQVVEGEFESDYDSSDDFSPLGGVVSGGRAIIAPITLPGAPEDGGRRGVVSYVVQQGDTVGAIAERFGVSVETILWENNKTSRSILRPGDVLKILPGTGVRHNVKKGDTLLALAKKYDVEIEKIKEFNRLGDEATLVIGESLVIPGGRPLRSAVPVRRAPSSFAVRAPVSVSSPSDLGTTLLWPTDLRVITQYYHARHSGLDIDGHYQHSIYASEDGVVVVAGWNSNGYGNYIIVDHGGGLRTLYAHANKMYVSKGQRVSRGQAIAQIGTTGRSTGTHLHYEVRVGNRRMNPLRYTR